jgi:hypothetical protein
MQFIYQIFVSCIISGEIEAITRIKIASVGLGERGRNALTELEKRLKHVVLHFNGKKRFLGAKKYAN